MKSMHSHSYVHACINFVYKVCMTINISYVYVCIASDNYIIGYIKLYASTIFSLFQVKCDTCDAWTHTKCAGVKDDIANKFFNCLECTDDRKDFIH